MKNFKQTRFSQSALMATSIAVLAAIVTACASPTTTSSPGASPATSPGASPAATGNSPQAQKNVRAQLAFLTQSIDAPLIVAISKGYFAAEGLNVTYERGFGNADTISKLGAGSFDIGFSDMYNALEFNEKNPNNQIIAVAITQNKAPFSIVSFKDKGINSPKDLEGKKLGAPAGDGPRKLFPLFAQAAGFDASKVEWTTMEPKLRESFLLQGQVDAVSGFSTSILPSLLKAGKTMNDINVFYYTDNGLDFYGNAILTRTDFAKQNPETVKAFIKAYMRGLQDVIKDPVAGLDAVIAADESKLMDRQAEKVRLQVALERLFITPEAEKIGLGAIDTQRLEKTIQQTVAGFQLKSNPTIADIYTDEFLPPAADRQVPPASDRKPLN